MTVRSLRDLALFQIVWLAAALGAGRGLSWPGIVTAAALVGLRLSYGPRRGRTALAILASGGLGLLAESLLVTGGFLHYSAPWPTDVLAPAWILGLWLAFGTTLEMTQSLLGSHPRAKSALLGVIFGPLAYMAGERLGALAVPEPAWPSYLAIAMVWFVAFPALLAFQDLLQSGPRRCRADG